MWWRCRMPGAGPELSTAPGAYRADHWRQALYTLPAHTIVEQQQQPPPAGTVVQLAAHHDDDEIWFDVRIGPTNDDDEVDHHQVVAGFTDTGLLGGGGSGSSGSSGSSSSSPPPPRKSSSSGWCYDQHQHQHQQQQQQQQLENAAAAEEEDGPEVAARRPDELMSTEAPRKRPRVAATPMAADPRREMHSLTPCSTTDGRVVERRSPVTVVVTPRQKVSQGGRHHCLFAQTGR
jgi:hypothetical protein